MKFKWNEEALHLFWYWVAERQAMYVRRTLGEPAPWSTDPVMASNHWTNVYRELDPGTVWVVQNVLQHRPASLEQVLFNTFAYRLFGSGNEANYQRLGFMDPAEFRPSWLRDQLRAIKAEGGQPFTSAYMVSNYGRSEDKADVMADVLDAAATGIQAHARRLLSASTRQAAHKALTGIYGAGVFVAFQVLVDLCYPLDRDGLAAPAWLPWSNDDWAVCGPGAWRGMQHLVPEAKRTQDNAVLVELCRMQDVELAKHDMRWPTDGTRWPTDGNGRRVRVSRANMQNCLCEYSKYMRLRSEEPGGGRRRRFDPLEAQRRDREGGARWRPRGGAVAWAVQTSLV